MLCRDQRGGFLIAASCDVQNDRTIDRVCNILTEMLNIAKKYGIRVNRVLSSHYLLKTIKANDPGCIIHEKKKGDPWDNGKIQNFQYWKSSSNDYTFDSLYFPTAVIIKEIEKLPLAAALSIAQDEKSLSVFCPVDDQCGAVGGRLGQTHDDSFMDNRERRHPFRDDSNVFYRDVH